jgi:hypothetical protein
VDAGKEGIKGNLGLVDWWSTTYDALEAGECSIQDKTLSEILAAHGRKVESMEDTIHRMYV